ncbi:uncharacterized protein C11orf16 homolog isoform X2 [Pyrgilauda ruficollis]|uniref:uncharacterized protein C11orf16 homolog isoform X2 n=1 Tax=Pyrgilauda ruficollis TaxID=221976 RepID=UPI001B87184C|nr:uncharacterized protein C11orf16 homolog isoform X2 [Pyrgilauda ruficollis]
MARLEGSLPRGHRYCSVRPVLDKFSCSTVISTINPCCRGSFVMYPAWIAEHLDPKRCQWISHCLPSPGPGWKSLGESGSTDSNVPVLARGEQDGFYYPGTVKEEIESERGMFLVEFAKPLVSRGRHPVCVQKTAQDDILEYVNGMKHSLLPGDRVLAPWEPDRARYGPGTVLRGIETRDPLRGPGNCTKDHLESKVISTGDMSSVAPAQQNAMFETTEQTPRGQLTLKKILRNQDFKPSLREGFAASEEQRYKAASDDKCEVTCAGADKPDVTDCQSSLAAKQRET